MAGQDEVSVIVPVFDGDRYLAMAIDSALAQTHRPLEIIVIDDGSTDESASIAQAYAKRELNVHYFHQSHRGIGAARNRGIAHAKGCYLAFLDADDLWCADKLTLQLAAFDRHPEVDLVFGHVTQFVSSELSDEQKHELRCPSDPMPGYLATTMLVPREVFHRVGLFETSLRVGEFLHWYLHAMELQLGTIMLPDVVMRRRIHTSNQGRRERDARTDYAHVLKAALDRRRAAADDIPGS
jgi:glycosyltransferase involved in cell wall biosynthesis